MKSIKNKNLINTLYSQGYRYVVTVHYSYNNKSVGDILSKHRTYRLADMAAAKNAYARIIALSDLIN